MAGIEHDTLSDIQEIRRLLDGYAEGFAFIKELIQNAEDAVASELRLAWHQGLARKAKHPLLRGPGLVVLNDGPFEKKHRDGLMRMGLGSKASDAERIGRFGLGMKAVFHVCEGFFFFEKTGNKDLKEFFSPWHPEHHTDWDHGKDSSDWTILHDEVKGMIDPSWPGWFAVWIPLRSQDHCKVIDPIRTGSEAFPGDHTTGCPESLRRPFKEVAPRAGEALIFLQHLRSVVFFDQEGRQEIQHDLEQRLVGTGSRYYRKDAEPLPALATEWQKKPAWPKVFEVGERLSSHQTPDKARWEAAVAVSLNRDGLGSGTLRLFWSVFLPVGNTPAEEIALQGFEADLHIFLHGYFFLNDSRTKVFGVDDGFKDANESHERGIRVAWNRHLATSENGLLPLVIPALADCFRQEQLESASIGQVVAALAASRWFNLHRDSVASKLRFGRFLRHGEWDWCELSTASPVLVMPSCGLTLEDTEKIIQRLLPDTGDVVVAIETSPILASKAPNVTWSASELDSFCNWLLRKGLTMEPSARSYLRELLACEGIPTDKCTAWKDLPIYEVQATAHPNQLSVPATQLEDWVRVRRLFLAGDRGTQLALTKACPQAEVFFLRDTGPPRLGIPRFTSDWVAQVAWEQEVLSIASDRLELIRILLAASVDPDTTVGPLRYLLHGSWPHSKDVISTLLVKGGEWEAPVGAMVRGLGRDWCWVESLFHLELNEHQMDRLSIHHCDAASFRALCNDPASTVALPQGGLHEFHDFLLQNLNGNTADDELLRSLPIHCYAKGCYTSVLDGIWLAPRENHIRHNEPLWKALRAKASIVARSDEPFIALRQESIFWNRMLDRDGIIRLAAKQSEPWVYVDLILECLGQGSASREAVEALRESHWLPLRKGAPCKMDQVVWIKDAEEELDRITSQLTPKDGLVTRSALAIDWEPEGEKVAWRRQGWGTMANPGNPLIPAKTTLVRRLSPSIESASILHLGITLKDKGEISEWLESVEGIEADFPHAVALIRKLLPSELPPGTQDQDWLVDLALLFFKPWVGAAARQYDTALEALKTRHKESSQQQKERIARTFDLYLSAAREAGRWDDDYKKDPTFELLNQDGDWRPINLLAAPIPGIARSALVRELSARALGLVETSKPVPLSVGEQGEAGEDEELSELLRNYAEALGDRLQPRHWGVFLAMLGPNVRDLADEFTDKRTDVFRDNLVGPEKSDPRIRLVQCTYRCEILAGNSVTLAALNGGRFDAARETLNASLLLPQAGGNASGNRHFVIDAPGTIPLPVSFKLKSPESLQQLTAQELRICIEHTIRIIQAEVLGVDDSRRTAVGTALDTIQKLEQKSLSLAQQEILGSCRMHFTQLAVRRNAESPLSFPLSFLEEAERFEAQAREEQDSGFGNWQASWKSAKELKERGINELRRVLGEHDGLHLLLADAMRRRIEQDQYLPGSIAFELFQNADDALAELPSDSDAPRIFIAEFGSDDARFAHWGRPINHPRIGEEGAGSASTRDLVKMLILHGSDKHANDGQDSPTGKFGLGFKSVYLVTDCPEVVSKDLAFEVRGASYPKRLAEAARSHLGGWIEEVFPGKKGGTAIRLPFRVAPPPEFESSFRRLAPYLPIFAKEIREIRVLGKSGSSHSWKPQVLHQDSTWRLYRGEATVAGRALQLLQLVHGSVSWLFCLERQGIVKIKDLPCLWITAPTLEADDLGFAINGPFEPDPGRTRLSIAGDETNRSLFRSASQALELFLRWCLEQGEQLGKSLAAQDGFTAKSYWKSLWELFGAQIQTDKEKSAKSRILEAIWKEASGYRAIIESHSVIPNGLSEAIDTLTSVEAVRLETKGFMDSKSGIELLEAAFEWEEMKDAAPELRITPREIVSSKVASMLRSRLGWNEPLPSLSLPFLLRRLSGADSKITPELGGKIGLYLNKARLFPEQTKGSQYDWPTAEKETLIDCLKELRFFTHSGFLAPATDLLIPGADAAEGIRAAIASPDRRLDPDYGKRDAALDFFRLCRGEMKVSAKDLSDWLRDSAVGADSNRRFDALRFLASVDALVAEAAGGLDDATRTSLLECPEFFRLSSEDQNRVKNAFQAAKLQQAQREGRLYEQQPIPLVFEDEDLHDEFEVGEGIESEELVSTWDEAGALRVFTLSGPLRDLVLPGACNDDQLVSLLRKPDTIEGKAAWYRLLCLGCSFGILLGPRPFERVMDLWRSRLGDDFWYATVPLSLKASQSAAFNQKLDGFFEQVIHKLFKDENASGEDAEFWRRVFYDFRKMHYFVFRNQLPETMLDLASYDETDGHVLINFLRSGQIPDALRDPAHPRFRGVIGQSMTAPLLFVMRELRRLGVLSSERFDSACYYMNSPARRVARKLGWVDGDATSRYDFSELVGLSEQVHVRMSIDAPELLGFFDLPLQWYAYRNPR